MNVEIEVFEHQELFLLSEAKHTGLIGGYGSGKSWAGVMKTVLKKMRYPGIPVAYYLPTYSLIKDVAYGKFSDTLEQFGIPYDIHKQDKDIITPYGPVYLRSMDNPSTIVGYQVGYSLIDETDILPTDKMTDVFSKIIARNRAKLPDGSDNCTDVVGTPEGFKWAYKFFIKDSKPNRVIIRGRTEANTELPPGYIDTLRDVYTESQLQAYLEGEFVNLTTGSVYHAFDRRRHHTDRMPKENDVLHVGMDFNIMNMHAVINVIEGGVAMAVDEIVKGYDTNDVISKLKERFPKNQIVVYPDAAGKARSTSGKSDHQLLREAGLKLVTSDKNPFVRDRVNAMNTAFRKNELLVNTHRCPTLTEALENQAYDKNGEPDKSSGYDHINEAEGYFIAKALTRAKQRYTFSY